MLPFCVGFRCLNETIFSSCQIKDILDQNVIDITALRTACFSGIPDNERLRPVCWRVLLNYLPVYVKEWAQFLKVQRKSYAEFVDDLIVKPEVMRAKGEEDASTPGDHPLSLNPESTWSAYFKDNENLLQINKDVRRLCPDYSFFQQATEYPSISIVCNASVRPLSARIERKFLESHDLSVDRSGANHFIPHSRMRLMNDTEEYKELAEGQEAHWEVVQRLLFIYSKLNPGVKYVQGMNEIIGPIYYVFATDPDPEWAAYAEADAFFCFQNLLSEIKDFFIKTLDSSTVGIESSMSHLFDLLLERDPVLHAHMQGSLCLLPQYFAFRWISLLLSQEFPLPSVIQIWDSLFSDAHRFDFMIYVCLAMIINLREELLASDFSGAMKMLQNYPTDDVVPVVSLATRLQAGEVISSPP